MPLTNASEWRQTAPTGARIRQYVHKSRLQQQQCTRAVPLSETWVPATGRWRASVGYFQRSRKICRRSRSSTVEEREISDSCVGQGRWRCVWYPATRQLGRAFLVAARHDGTMGTTCRRMPDFATFRHTASLAVHMYCLSPHIATCRHMPPHDAKYHMSIHNAVI